MKRAFPTRVIVLALALAPLAATGAPAGDWEDCEGWKRSHEWGHKGRYCEVRELTLPALGSLAVDAGQNGGISVRAWNRGEIRVEARIMVWNESEQDAVAAAAGIEIRTEGARISAEAPDGHGWSVSYRIQAPRETDLDLEAHNGGIGVQGIAGELRLETVNGGLSLAALAGDVRARTSNGGVHVELDGERWSGAGLDVETTNGGVHLEVPEGYSAEFEAGTVNGHFRIDLPITVQGRIGRDIRTTLGSGGPPVRVRTTNGGVKVTSTADHEYG